MKTLEHLDAVFAKAFQPKVDKVFQKSEIVHFSRVLVIDNKYIQVLTEYDGDKDEYTEFFRRELPDVFEKIFALVEDAPPWSELQKPEVFLRFGRDHNLKALGEGSDPKEGYLYSASAKRRSSKSRKPSMRASAHSQTESTASNSTAWDQHPRGAGRTRRHCTDAPSHPRRQWLRTCITELRSNTTGDWRRDQPAAGRLTVKKARLARMLIDFKDLQGFVPRSYRCPITRYLLVRFGDAEPARAFLQRMIPQITTADQPAVSSSKTLWNLALTASGLKAVGLAPAVLDQFESAFIDGPNATSLGAFGESQPTNWWNRRFSTGDIHALIQLGAWNDQDMADATGAARQDFARHGITELIYRTDGQAIEGRSLAGRRLHFAYTDGISHPDVRWGDDGEAAGTVDFRNFLLGYPKSTYPSSPSENPARDLVRGSSYAVLEVVYQDVSRFERFLTTNAGRLAPNLPLSEGRELLAAKMLGRWRDGTSLILSPDGPNPAFADRDDFGYAAVPEGLRCPIASHVRVVNPRDQPLDVRVTGTPESGPLPFGPVPKMLRRGLSYGPELVGDQDDGVDRGLVGLFLVASIHFQIYTLTRWMKATNFSPLFRGRTNVQDALFANRKTPGAAADLVIPTDSGPVSIPVLPDFIRSNGVVFFLLPSLPTLRALARTGITQRHRRIT